MSKIWNYIDQKDLKAGTKFKLALLSFSFPWGLAGLSLWLLVRFWAFSSLDYMLCFIGYPVVLSLFSVIFYAYGHDFHERSYRRWSHKK